MTTPRPDELTRAIERLHRRLVDDLEPDDLAHLASLARVRVELVDGDVVVQPGADQALRDLLDELVEQSNGLAGERRRFVRLWLNLGDARTAPDAERDWRDAAGQASAAAFGTSDTYDSVARAMRRRSGAPWEAIRTLAEAVLLDDERARAPERPRSFRNWLFDGPAAPPTGRFVFVTAHHGTGLRSALDKYADRYAQTTVIHLDRYLAEAGLAYRQAVPDPTKPMPGRSRVLNQIYDSCSRRELHWIWRDALDRLWPKLTSALHDGQTLLFACSTAIYHSGSGSIAYAINDIAFLERVLDATHADPPVAAALRNAQAFTLIDDVFDCFVRLSQQGEPLDPTITWPSFHPTRSAAMRTILEWRQQEVIGAERFARLLNWRHQVLPVKHRLDTFHKLIEGRPAVYLSHPVRAIRADAPNGGEAVGEHARVLALCDALAEADDFALLEPLGIDESRFRTTREPERRNLRLDSHELLPRWRSARELLADAADRLWEPVALDPVEQPFPPRPAEEPDRADPSRLWSVETDETLLLLHAEIERHRRWRLRLAVNQCAGGMLVHRPFALPSGEPREGFGWEVDIRRRLQGYEQFGARRSEQPDPPARPLIVFHPRSDERRRAVANLADGLRGGEFLLGPDALGDAVLLDVDDDASGAELAEAFRRALADGLPAPGA